MLLGRLDSCDESMMLNQFIWGLEPELACSVSLQYPNSIVQAVSLAETIELAVKASRRPTTKGGNYNQAKGPNQSNWGRGQWRGASSRGRGRGSNYSGSGRGRSGGGRSSGGRGCGSSGFDPLACYRCGVHGHLACDYPSTSSQSQTLGSGSTGPTNRGSFKPGQANPKRGRGCGRQAWFGGLNVLYDEDGNQYPVDDVGQLYVSLEFGQTVAEGFAEENKNEIKY